MTTSTTEMSDGAKAFVDRILSEVGPMLCTWATRSGTGSAPGSEHEREILSFGESLPAHRDLPTRANRALNDGRTTHHAVVENDRHVILQVLPRLVAETAAALVAELETRRWFRRSDSDSAGHPSDSRR